ncbi:MAG: ATP-binding protein, partial [Sulfurovum sp.]
MKSIIELIKSGENQTIEFKTSFQKEVISSIVAFANAKGGKVLIGVSDSGKIIGIQIQRESLQDWINQIKLNTQPSILVDI